jgi:transposase
MDVGVDTHKKTHVLVAVGTQGQTLGTRTVANTPAGWAAALQWAREQQQQHIRWGVENSGSLGKGFAQFLLAQGETEVREVVPHRTAQYRRRGRTQDKTDTADALAMARLLGAEGEGLPLVHADDASTELRLLSDHRDNLIADRTRLINQLHAQMLQLDPRYEERSGPLTQAAGVRFCQEYDPLHADALVRTRLLIVRQLATRIAALTTEIAALTALLGQRVAALGTPLLQLRGVGPVVAARLLGELGGTLRVHSAAALAALAGIAPVAVASGNRHGHRVNFGGNRQLNRAIHIIALTQRRCEPLAQAYYAKKRAEGKTARAAMRCLKRRLVDVLYRLWQTQQKEPKLPLSTVAA